MPRKKRTTAELNEASNHLHYEISMLHAVANGLGSGLFGPGPVSNALVESFAVHVRGLIDFLYSENPRPDDVVAEDYFADTAQWAKLRPPLSDVLSLAKRRAGKEIAHLTYARLDVTPDIKPWQFLVITNEIAPILSLFLQNISSGLLGNRWHETKAGSNQALNSDAPKDGARVS